MAFRLPLDLRRAGQVSQATTPEDDPLVWAIGVVQREVANGEFANRVDMHRVVVV